MADFRTTFVAAVLLYFSCTFLIGCAQQYEDDSGAEAQLSSWQSSRTRGGVAPSRFDSSSPDAAARIRQRSQRRYDQVDNGRRETAREYVEEGTVSTPAARQRGRGRPAAGRRTMERRVDDVTEEITPSEVTQRRRPSRVRVTESTTQAVLDAITTAPRVRYQNAPRGFALDKPPRHQRGREETSSSETTSPAPPPSSSSPRPFSRGRVKAKIYEKPRKPESSEDISESDNYPPGFIERIRTSEQPPREQPPREQAAPRRSRLRQRAAKSYPSIAISDSNRYRTRYTRYSTEKPKEEESASEGNKEETEKEVVGRKNSLYEARQRSRSRYTTQRATTTSEEVRLKPFRNYGRRLTTTPKVVNGTTEATTTANPRQKYLGRLKTGKRQFKPSKPKPETKKEEEDEVKEVKKETEGLQSAENSFYKHPEDQTEGITTNLKNPDGDLEPEASEEDQRVENATVTAVPATATTVSSTSTSTTTTTTTTTSPTVTTTPRRQQTGALVAPTRHRFSSRFSRSNRTTISDDVTPPILDALVSTDPTPINLTSLFDDAPDSTLSIMTLFNNSFAASTSVATNKTNPPEPEPTAAVTTTARPSPVRTNTSTNPPTTTNTTTKRTSSKKSQNKKPRKSTKTTTPSPVDGRPVLRNLAALFAGPEVTTRRGTGKKKKTSRTTTTTTTTTPSPQELAAIQNYINETMEVIHNRTVVPAPVQAVPRVALNALTPETSVEEATTMQTVTTSSTTAATTTTTSTKSPVTTTTTTSTTTPATTTTTSTTTPATTTSATAATATPIAARTAQSAGGRRRNCTSQFVYFDYNSPDPIPRQFANFQRNGRPTESTTTTTTADYFVFGVYPNNSVVRRRAWKAFDYEKYHSPYVIFGIYPNNTIVKKFPNGTIIKDEYMTSDNEIRDIMNSRIQGGASATTERTTTSTERATTTTTTAKPETTTTKKVEETTTTSSMRMESSDTTENRLDDDLRAVTTEATTESAFENPDSMFEFIANEIEELERQDEELSSLTTEAAPTTEGSRSEADTTTEARAGGEATTEVPFRVTESDDEAARGRSTTEATEVTTIQGSREGKAFSFEELFNLENIMEGLTEGSVSRETTEREMTTEGGAFREATTGGSSRETTTGGGSRETTEGSSRETTTTTTEPSSRETTTTTTESSSREAGTTTTEASSRETTTTTTEVSSRETTTTAGSTTTETTGLDFEKLFGPLDSNTPTTTTTTARTTTTESRTTDAATSDFDLQQIFQSTTARYDDNPPPLDIDIRLNDGPVYVRTTEGGASEAGASTAAFSVTPESVASTTPGAPTTTLGAFEGAQLASTVTEGRSSEETTTASFDFLNEVDLFRAPENENANTRSTVEQDENDRGLLNLAFRALGSSNTITPAPTATTPKYVTSTMKSTNFKEKKVKMKLKRTSTTTTDRTAPAKENVFIVTPETTLGETFTDFTKKGKVKFVTLTPGVIVTTDVRDENDVMTMSSQHVQKVTKAPANIPDNFLNSVVGEIQEKSSSPIPDIIKNVEKELQGNGISVSLARRIIEMAIERAITTETPDTTTPVRETTTITTPYVTTRWRVTTTTPAPTTTTTKATTTTQQTTTAFVTPRTESTTPSEVSTVYSELLNTVNINPLSVGFVGDYTETTTKKMSEDDINKLVQGLWQTTTTTARTTTTTTKRPKSTRNKSAAVSTLSENDKLLLEAILKQQNSNLSVQELDKIIENQIRLAEEVRKASKNMKKKKPRVTTTTTTTTQTPPLFGFLISLFSGNSSPSNIPVTKAPLKQTRARAKPSRGQGSMSKSPKINLDPLRQAENGNHSGERSTRGELVTAAIDVTKAVSKFMGTFISSAAQSFQAFFSNFGRGKR